MIKEILLSNKCVNIEPTQQEGKIFILTTKTNIADGRQWLNENLPPIFTNHLMKNPNFQLDPDNPIACCDDQVQHNPTLADYANALTTQSLLKTSPITPTHNRLTSASTATTKAMVHQSVQLCRMALVSCFCSTACYCQ